MLWLSVAIFAYFLLALVFLVDKYLLVGPIPNPRVYAFYIGILQALVFLLIPFVDFLFLGFFYVFLGLASGVFFILALFWFYKGLQVFEPSRIVPAMGGLMPIFTFCLVYAFSGGEQILKNQEFLAFLFLIAGSVLITSEKKKISLESLKVAAIAAFFFAVYTVLAKYVYLVQPFWSGFIWIRAGSLLAGLVSFFLFSDEIKAQFFKKKKSSSAKGTVIFLANQAVGAGGNVLQSWALALAPLVYVSLVNALVGLQYVFLLIFAVILSLKFPQILKEEVSKETILQKMVALLLIGGGLAVLALK